ncbi:MAG: non-homologous end-joining DNA ligase [Bacillota bacterium]
MTLPLIRPMLAVAARPFSDADYIFEVKWDGYRCLAYLDRDTALRSRNLLDLTPAFTDLAGIHEHVTDLPVVIDGEIVVLADGRPDFGSLQARGRLSDPKRIAAAEKAYPAVFVAFDLLYRRGRPVFEEPLTRRRDWLREIVRASPEITVADYVSGDGEAFFEACKENGLEGIMAKRRDSPYLAGRRSPYWKKVRAWKNADLVICAWEPGGGPRRLGSLYVGGYRDGGLVFAGRVGTGFDAALARDLLDLLARIPAERPLFDLPRGSRGAPEWVEPVLVCTVDYTEVTREGLLRHPVFRGLRGDKLPQECSWQPGPP